jgi:hypothetical protein
MDNAVPIIDAATAKMNSRDLADIVSACLKPGVTIASSGMKDIETMNSSWTEILSSCRVSVGNMKSERNIQSAFIEKAVNRANDWLAAKYFMILADWTQASGWRAIDNQTVDIYPLNSSQLLSLLELKLLLEYK